MFQTLHKTFLVNNLIREMAKKKFVLNFTQFVNDYMWKDVMYILMYPRVSDFNQRLTLDMSRRAKEEWNNVLSDNAATFAHEVESLSAYAHMNKDTSRYIDFYIIDNDEIPAVNREFRKSDQWKKTEKTVFFEHGYVLQTDATTYLHGFLPISEVYVHPETFHVIIVMSNVTTVKMRAVLCVMPKIVPWVFEKHPLTNMEAELLISISQNSYDDFVEKITSISRSIDIQPMMKQQYLTNIAHELLNERIEAAKAKKNREERNYRDLMNAFTEAIKNVKDASALYEALVKQLVEVDKKEKNELLDYALANKNLYLNNKSGQCLYFTTKSRLDNFDADMYRKYSENGRIFRDYGLSNDNPFSDPKNAKMLLDAIFETEEIHVWVCGYFALFLNGSVNSERNHTYNDDFCKDLIPNPHLQIHNCLSMNGRKVIEFLNNGDYVSAIEQCFAATRNLNLSEVSQTVRPFFQWIFTAERKKCIETPDGFMTPSEALAWLKAKHAPKTEEKKSEELAQRINVRIPDNMLDTVVPVVTAVGTPAFTTTAATTTTTRATTRTFTEDELFRF